MNLTTTHMPLRTKKYINEQRMTKPTKWHVRWTKTQISPIWSESSPCALWVAKDPSFLHADSEDSDQTGRIPRLIWVLTGCTCHFVGFVTRWLISYEPQFQKTYLLSYALHKDLNSPAHPHNMIKVSVVEMKQYCILGYPKFAQWRFWSESANAQVDLDMTFSDVAVLMRDTARKWPLFHIWATKTRINWPICAVWSMPL